MKDMLIKLLALLSEEKIDIVREVFHSKIKEGDDVYINGGWCKWIRSHDERTLTHVTYISKYGSTMHHTNHSGMFLTRVNTDDIKSTSNQDS